MTSTVSTQELKSSLEKFKAIPFPWDSDDLGLSELHAELAEYDGFIVGLVDSILAHKSVDKSQLIFDTDLENRLKKLTNSNSSTVAAEAKEYLDYLGALKLLVEAAQKHIS